MMAADAALSIGEKFVDAASREVLSCDYQPGVYRRNKKTGSKEFVPNPHFPRGVHIGFPAWFVATVGIGAAIVILQAMGKTLSGLGLSRKEKNVWDQWGEQAMSFISPPNAIAKGWKTIMEGIPTV